MTSFILVFALSVLMVAKHFAYHYFTPVLLLKTFFLFLMFELIIQFFKQKKIQYSLWALAFLISIVLVIGQIPSLRANTNGVIANTSKFDKRYDLVKPYFNTKTTLIISSHFRGSPFIQTAFGDGFLISGSLKSTYKDELNKRYPDTYFSFGWTEDFYYWNKFLKPKDFVKTGENILIFIGEDKEKDLDRILNRIKLDFPGMNLNLELLLKLESPKEYLYYLKIEKPDTAISME